MADIYLVTDGVYSDYQVLAAFSTEDAARTYIDEGRLLTADVEVLPIDQPARWGDLTKVEMLRDGGVQYVTTKWAKDPVSGYKLFGHWGGDLTLVQSYRQRGLIMDYHTLINWVVTGDHARAIKVTGELRARLIATGEWPPEGWETELDFTSVVWLPEPDHLACVYGEEV